MAKICEVGGCGRRHTAHGLCHTHYAAAWAKGTLPARQTREQRFWSRVKKTDTCWLWTGSLNVGGYGRFAVTHRRTMVAHRWLYEQIVGPVPDDMHLDHLCRVRACVNPEHLEVVTPRENLRRSDVALGIRTAKTHCPKGHAYTPENTRITGGSRRVCRTCQNAAGVAYRRRKVLARG